MQKDIRFYVGIDVSKLTLDISLLIVKDHRRGDMVTERFSNDTQGLKALNKWLNTQKVSFDANSLVVIENTGVYHRLIWEYCSKHNLPIYIGNATHIKWSFGIARGKNDRIDSQRLCDYGCKHADDLKATAVLNPVLLKLKDLMTARSRLIAQAGSIKVYLKELKLSNSKEVQKIMEQAHAAALEGIKTSLALIEKEIHLIIACQPEIKRNYELLITVPGIGHLTAVYIIGCTNNFNSRLTGKQLACYAGVAPFENSSGTSIRGRNKVHKMANKTLKKMLHLCAISSIKYYVEFRQYYERKIAEGKHPMKVINAIRNKIVLRAVAVINNQQPYVDNFKKAA